ncbi:MAG: fumarylacetoacetate hydrolase family protein [Candidatus Thermoplasmatota archaeon]|nr:fumarylacetoacetate hydrolase family protein [Candidatus Thermoplasmatota archaeon]
MPHFVQGSHRFEIGKIVCIEVNEEDGPPVVFLKPATSVIHQDEEVNPPEEGGELSFGIFYAMAIGERTGTSIKAKMSSVLGFGLLMDIYDGNLLTRVREQGLPWDMAKGRDTYCPLSEFTPSQEIGDPYGHEVYMQLNGMELVKSSTRDLQMNLEDAMHHISGTMTLAPGDLLAVKIKECEGTLRTGDEIEAGISSVGIIRNRLGPSSRG